MDNQEYFNFDDNFRYAKEIIRYVANHRLKNRTYTDKEATNIFLLYINDTIYTDVIKEYKTSIFPLDIVFNDCKVPVLAGKIDQMRPYKKNTPIKQEFNRENKSIQGDHIRSLEDYYDVEKIKPDNYCEYVSKVGASPYIWSFWKDEFLLQGGQKDVLPKT